MTIFAVQYFYSADAEDLAALRPSHRAWQKANHEAGNILVSGPMVDFPGALLIWQADSLEDLVLKLDQDPFDIAGYIGERTIGEWNPLFGPFK